MATARRSLSSYGGFAEGLLIRGMPILTLFPGNVYWVDSGGGGGAKGTFKHPCLTLAAAHALVTTDNGDIIVVKPGHAETYTATVPFSKSGFAIIGMGFGDNRPTFTNGVTATGDDMFDFAGDDIVIYNLKWKEAAPAGSAAVIFNVSGDNIHIENCYLELGAKTTIAVTHDTTAKKGFSFINNVIVGTAAGPDAGVIFEKTHLYAHVEGNKWLMGQSLGMDLGCIIFTSGTTGGGDHLIRNERAMGISTTETYLTQTDVQNMSIMENLLVMGQDATANCGASPASGFGFFWNFALEEGKGIPGAVDIAGARPIDTTPAS